MTTQPTVWDEVGIVGAFGADELPDDLRGFAKANATRKVNRLLERVSLAPFVAGLSLYRRQPVGEPDRVALLTVSGWDPGTPVPAAGPRPTGAELADFYQHPPGIGDYLQRMPNNAICQLSIAGGFRGPNVHYTGEVDSLALMMTVAAGHVVDGSADCALVVAYDVPVEQRHALPDTADSTAAAVLLAPATSGTDLGTVPELLTWLAGAPRPIGAVAALQQWLTAARPAAATR